MANLFPPTVTVEDRTVELGDFFPVHTAFSVTDLDPDSEVVKYRFRDSTTTPQSGYFSMYGTPKTQGVWFEIDASLIFEVKYNAGTVISSEAVQIQVFDGLFWSDADFGTWYTVAANNLPPTGVIDSFSVLATEAIAMADLVSFDDVEGYPITKMMFVDRLKNANGGFFTLDGVKMDSAKWFQITPDQLSGLKYVGGQFGQTERLGFRVYDGKFWSVLDEADATTTPNIFRPETTAIATSVLSGSKFEASRLFDYFDQDGNSLKKLKFIDAGGSNTSGYFEVDGVKQLANQAFEVMVEDLHKVYYVGGDPFTSEMFRVQGFDGRHWGALDSALLTSVTRASVDAISHIFMVDELESVKFSDMVVNSPGPTVLEYEVIDMNDLSTSAKLRRNGQTLAAHETHRLTANQFDQLYIQGGPDDVGRSYDNFLVRANNGFGWSAWERVNVSTDPVNEAAVQDISQWNDANGEPVHLTYNFPLQVPWYYCDPRIEPFLQDECNLFQTMRAEVRAATREVLDMLSTYINVTFEEISASAVGDIIFAEVPDPDGTPGGVLGYTYVGAGTPGQINDPFDAIEGDVWIIQDELNNDLEEGGIGYATIVHEMGHSLGLKHSFQGTPILPPAMESDQYTIMSYTGGYSLNPGTPMLYDVMALQTMYGRNLNYNPGNTQIRFDNNVAVPMTIFDPSGIDTFNMGNSTLDASINLNQGQYSSVGGEIENIAIAWGTDVENARGGSGADTIVGNDLNNLMWGNLGRDILRGMGGNDVMRGGAQSDTYIVGIGDGFDIIDEEKLAGRDVLEVHGFGSFASLEKDFTFRRLGHGSRDLRMDLTLDRGTAHAGLTIKNQKWGGSRIETLKLFDVEGNQIGEDINLDSIFQLAVNAPQQFIVTNNTSPFGNLAVPV